jgi:hypothetical protein
MSGKKEIDDVLNDFLGADFEPHDAYTAIDRVFAKGWDSPTMDDYDRYAELRKQGNIPPCVN